MSVPNELPEGYDPEDIEAIMVVCDGPPICGRNAKDRLYAQSAGCSLCQTVYKMPDGVQIWRTPTAH